MTSLNFLAFREILALINTWAVGLISSMGYPGLATVMFLENVFPPIPSEIILPLAGSMTISGRFSLLGITLVGMIGSVVGAWVFYGVGYWWDEKRLRFLIQRFGKWLLLSEDDLNRAITWFQRHGDWIVFLARMIPMVRSLISIPAGLTRMNFLRFTLFTALGTACWSFCLAFGGRLLGEHWTEIDLLLSQYEGIVLAALGLACVVFVMKKLNKNTASR
ncbi:MAG: DedA family protein [Chloroflexota bacterium]|jgi:membrane protein DedA with SNARE-associated domain